jgi:hypothetical protein
MSRRKRLVVAVATFALLLAGGVAVALPANAGTKYGCNYPQVCFYRTESNWLNDSPTARYKDVTSYFQALGKGGKGAAYIYNTRSDDGALIQFTSGDWYCVAPGQLFNTQGYTANGIRIMDSETCGARWWVGWM